MPKRVEEYAAFMRCPYRTMAFSRFLAESDLFDAKTFLSVVEPFNHVNSLRIA